MLEEQETAPAPRALTKSRLILLGSATAMTWTAGVMQVCGTGFILPVIQQDLKSTPSKVQWVNNAFNICWGSFALLSGRLSDLYGLRKAYLLGLSWCALWLLISAFVPNVAALSAARGLAGIGHAMACPAASGIIATYFPQGRPRTLAFAAMAGFGATGAGLGWLLGGVLGDVRYSWRVFTALIIPVMLYPLLIGYFTVPEDVPFTSDTKFDYIGAILITAAQIVLLLSLSLSVDLGWKTPVVPTLLGVSLLLFFGVVSWRPAHALIPRRVFASGQRIALYLGAACVFAGVDNLAINGAYYYAEVLQISSRQAGFRVVPSVAAGAMASILVAVTIPRIPARIVLVFCISLNSVCGILFALRTPGSAYWKFDLWAWMLNGFGTDGLSAIGGILISNTTVQGDQAVASAMLLSFSRFGAGLGLALTNVLRQEISAATTVNQGLRATFWFGASSLLLGALIVGFGMRGWTVIGKNATA